ncbi:MAG: filamentous hemagglutinin N-terminal domain-containing protein [Phormidesmis sp.]
MHLLSSRLYLKAVAVLGFCALTESFGYQWTRPAVAQSIRADTALSSEVTTSDNQNFTITAGQQRGSNLFHSFSDFSIPSGGSAYFNNLADISNIFSRVTGTSPSLIEGTLKANGTANLFLLNPQGIIFAEQANLSIGGAFIGSTAQSLRFADGTLFDTAAPAPLLTVSAPTGLQLGTDANPIRINGSGYQLVQGLDLSMTAVSNTNLQTNAGNTLALVGRGLFLNDAHLSTDGGHIELGSVDSGHVQFSSNPDTPSIWAFNYDQANSFEDIQLSNSLVEGIGSQSGQIHLQGNDISLERDSMLFVQNQGLQPFGDIAVDSTGTLTIQGLNISALAGLGTVGSSITTESLLGYSGDITVTARRLDMTDGGGLFSRSVAAPGGNISVVANEAVEVTPSALFTANIDSTTVGPFSAGNVTIETDRLSISGGSKVSSITYGLGNSGNVTINNAVSVDVSGTQAFSRIPSLIGASSLNRGHAGDVTINTQRLALSAGGRVDSSAAASGDAGNVTIIATESVTVQGESPDGADHSLIASSADIIGNELLRTQLGLPSAPEGDAGSVTIKTPVLEVSDRAEIAVRNRGTGSGGTLRLTADTIALNNAARLSAATFSGNGGNISVRSHTALISRNQSRISAESGGTGNGGNISIKTPFLLALENSDIVADASRGQGGNVTITAQSILGTQFREQTTSQSDITASSEFGLSGVVNIERLETNPGTETVELPDNVADISEQIVTSCVPTQTSQFVATGRGGLPISPQQQIQNGRLWQDTRAIAPSAIASSQPNNVASTLTSALDRTFVAERNSPHHEPSNAARNAINEATSWTLSDEGKIHLIAQVDNTSEAHQMPDQMTESCLSHVLSLMPAPDSTLNEKLNPSLTHQAQHPANNKRLS